MNNAPVEWIKCHHGFELRKGRCPLCEKERNDFLTQLFREKPGTTPARIPIRRGCRNQGGCFCSGSCKEIVGYRDPVFTSEKETI